ncbi:hypothetical protein ACQKFK_32675 [Bacillus mycoides]
MYHKKAMLKKWKADLQAMKEEKDKKIGRKKQIKNILYRVIQLHS